MPVQELVETLTEPEYRVIRLLFQEQMSTQEAAGVLGIPQSDVLRTQRSALARMREHLTT